MRIDYLGHACFLVTGDSGARMVFDPYDPGCFGGALGFGAPDVAADLVLVSHGHADHGAADEIAGSPRVVSTPAPGEHKGIACRGLETFHDDAGGSARGPNVIFTAALDGVTFCHLGDLGHALSAAQAGQIGKVDVLFAPVGGHFTIDAAGAVAVGKLLGPRVLVPMHFKTAKVAFPIAPLGDFLKVSPWPAEARGSGAEFAPAELPAATTVWAMEPSR